MTDSPYPWLTSLLCCPHTGQALKWVSREELVKIVAKSIELPTNAHSFYLREDNLLAFPIIDGLIYLIEGINLS